MIDIEQAFAPARTMVEQGRMPCAAVGVIDADGDSAVAFTGSAAIVPEPEPLTRDHWFDLASVSKVIATTTIVLILAEQGRLDLDAPLASVIPDLRQYDIEHAPERRITFRQCLAHQTFLPAVFPIYTYGDDPLRARAFVLQRAWEHGPPVYSDINFILLGIAVERITGAPMSAWSLGEGLSYGPPPGPAVSTEFCTWRDRILKGEVHDENAAALGGAPGHAGLFGTVDGVLEFARALMSGEVLSPESMRLIRTSHFHHRTHGWELPYGGWSGGEACSRTTIGHTGFTGTGLWIDFERKMAWTLLTNRVHPTRHRDRAIYELRPQVSDAVIAAWDAAH
ncbi:serine hydrolase domain-containing protein [Qipengyuania sp. MTN3-11]|uniref:serine hydrolase domain-containing protein n=1 Tax=Qipengyuania sp. MTN3-11 TaxID=3056557 RepID=UPI0036F273CF